MAVNKPIVATVIRAAINPYSIALMSLLRYCLGNWPSRKEWLTGKYKKSVSGLTVSFAKILVADPLIPGGRREEVHMLTGNCYVLNDRGRTIESFWARRTPKGELVSEQ